MRKILKYNVISIIVVTLLTFMSIGYALYDKTVALNGNLEITQPGKIAITSATVIASTNVTNPTNPSVTGNGMDLEFTVDCNKSTCSVTYLIVIENNSFYEYTFTNIPINASIQNSSNVPKITAEITDISGKKIEAGTTIGIGGEPFEIKLKLDFDIGEAGTIGGSGSVSASEDNTGSIVPVSITPPTGNLQNGAGPACFTATISNTFKYARSLTFASTNDTIKLVDENGIALSEQTIEANSTSNFKICTAVSEGSIFTTNSATTTIQVTSNELAILDVGTVTLAVDISEEKDTIAPEVGNVTLSISETYTNVGDVLINWTRTDTSGGTNVSYKVFLYNDSGTQVGTSDSATTSCTINAKQNGTYYAVVYGIDEAGNSGLVESMNNKGYTTETEALANSTTENDYISKSEATELKWTFNVTTTLEGLASSNTATTVNLNQDYETTFTVTATGSGFFQPTLPGSVTVTMNGETLTEGYTYDSSTGTLIISKVTGDVTIKATNGTMCLIEGTKIRLANGSYKNIEDITYTDLLAVYDHENGGITYEYPIWIETKKTTTNYQTTTFSDGTILKTYGPHAIFSMDTLEYVSVTDKNKFKKGSKVAKINKDGSIKVISVTNIEQIEEKVNYYQIISTRYHNIIANDLVTSEGTMITTYAFPHNKDLTWTKERKAFLKTNDLFYYEDWTHLFKEHIFKGFRMEEAKHLYNKEQFDIELFSSVLNNLAAPPLKNNKGKNLWMISTSENEKKLYEEGSYYTLKIPNNRLNFIGWYNTADNKIYNIGEKVKVTYGMHFIAKYK